MSSIGTSSLRERQSPDTRSLEIDRKDRSLPQSGFVIAERAHDCVADDRGIDFIGANLRDARLTGLQVRVDCCKPEVVRQNRRAVSGCPVEEHIIVGIRRADRGPMNRLKSPRSEFRAPLRRQIHVDQQFHRS